jgi:hypothetical protein
MGNGISFGLARVMRLTLCESSNFFAIAGSPHCHKNMAARTPFTCRSGSDFLCLSSESRRQSRNDKRFFGNVLWQSATDKLCQLRSKSGS